MVLKVYFPKLMRKNAFWGTPQSNYLMLLLLLITIMILSRGVKGRR
uniref:Transmembrane protein n=1 Tax=Medicago truncatula TaxID=3880 RepID=I3T3F9_MEDTR|nr:unknown [Medicago truncatula]